MQASGIYINTHVLWTLNNNFTYLVIWCELNCLLWRVTLLIQIVENKFIVALVLLTVEFFLIFFILWFPVTFIFGATRFVFVHRLFDVSVIMTSNSFYFVKLPTNSGQSVFFQVEVKFFYLNLFDLATFNMAAVPFEVLVRSASCLFRSSASLVQMSFLISVTLRWLIYVITCFSSTLCFEQKLLMFLTLTECSSCKSFKHFLGR